MGMSPRSLLATLSLIPLHAAALQAQQPTIEPVPAWVDVAPSEFDAESKESSGVEVLLSDHQDDLTRAPSEHYTRIVKRVLDVPAVEQESQLEVEFDPAREALVFHEVAVVRDGQRTDQLDLERIQVIQREAELDSLIYHGRRTALLFLNDVRPGDVIDYSFTRSRRETAFGGTHFDRYFMQRPNPTRHLRRRLLWPSDRELAVANQRTEVAPVIRALGEAREYLWELRDLEGLEFDAELPVWLNPFPVVEVSEYRDWGEVARWGAELYEVEEPLHPELMALAAETRASASAPLEQLRLLLRGVQTDVRYLGVELGEGAYRPTPPNEVWARRYGDCKDKALLLVSLLAQLEIHAEPALVSSRNRRMVANLLPTPDCFDHVIVRVELDGDDVWVDPTMSLERGPINEHNLTPYGWALPLTGDSTELVAVVPELGVRSEMLVEKVFALNLDGPSRLKIKTTYTGQDAVWARYRFRDVSAEELTEQLHEYIEHEYSTAEVVAPAAARFDDARGQVVLTEQYTIGQIFATAYEGESSSWAAFYGQAVLDAFERPWSENRDTPFGISHPRRVVSHIRVDLPDDWNIEHGSQRVQNAAFHLTQQVSGTPRHLDLRLTFHTTADHVDADELDQYLRDLDEAEELLGYELQKPFSFDLGGDTDLIVGLGAAVVVGLLGLAFVGWLTVTLLRRDHPPLTPAWQAWEEERASPPSVPSGLHESAAAPLPSTPPEALDASTNGVAESWSQGGAGALVAAPPARHVVAAQAAPANPGVAPALEVQPGVRREGRHVVLDVGAELPERCAYCNAPATKHKQHTLHWHTAWLYPLLVAPVLFLIVAYFAQKRRPVRIGYCRVHRWSKGIAAWVSAAAFTGGGLCFAATPPGAVDPAQAAVELLGMLLVLLGVLALVFSAGRVSASFIGERTMSMRGFCKPYLESLEPR